jgi:hypothetical protein
MNSVNGILTAAEGFIVMNVLERAGPNERIGYVTYWIRVSVPKILSFDLIGIRSHLSG